MILLELHVLHRVCDLFQELVRCYHRRGFLLQEVDTFSQDLPCDFVALILILHKLILEQGAKVLEKLPIPFDSWQVQNGAVIDAPNCSSPSALEQVSDFSKNSARPYLANVVFPTGEIGTSHPALTFGKEIESRGFATLGNHNVFR